MKAARDARLATLRAAVDTLPDGELLKKFISLGENCEFGLVQRQAGIEPIGLMRFTLIFGPAEARCQRLTEAVADGFAGVGTPGTVKLMPMGGEYLIHEATHNFLYHTFRYEGVHDPAQVIAGQEQRLAFLRRKLLAEFAAGQHVFVWKMSRGVPEQEVRALHAALAKHGAHALLWAAPQEKNHPAGTVEDLGGGLLKGYVTRLSPEDAPTEFDYDSWIATCRAAVTHWLALAMPAAPTHPPQPAPLQPAPLEPAPL